MVQAADVRVVLADLDDTFLARDKSIPAGNLAALDLLSASHIVFVPCTGRPIAGIPTPIATHPATAFLVGSNGGLIADARTKQVLNRSVMPTDLVARIYEQVKHLNVTFDIFVPGHVLTERRRLEAMAGFGIDEANLNTIRSFREPRDESIPELLERYDGVEKVTIYWSDEAARDVVSSILPTFDAIDVTTSHPRNFEFMRKGTSKGSALLWICEHLGCSPEAAVAFGDSPNDLPMLVAAGDGVAVANAGEQTRGGANHVCGSCDEGGVGDYLRALLG